MSAVLSVAGVEVRYGAFAAVRDATLELEGGRTLAVVGESGSGKTTLALAIARLLPFGASLHTGTITVAGIDVGALAGADLRRSRGRLVGYLAQDALAALNPLMRAGAQIAEVFRVHRGTGRRAAADDAVALLRRVGIQEPELVARHYPHELSGGMRQRVMIAIALALEPRVLIADEPTTALDVIVQAEILALTRDLVRDRGTTLVWITHDMGVVAEVADEVAVMYGGRLVEHGSAAAVFTAPAHPYTQALLATARSARTGSAKERFPAIAGLPPAGETPSGCPFHPRCPVVLDRCADAMPPTRAVADGHRAACHLLGET